MLTLSWAQGALGWMTVVFLFHVPQYAGRWFSENCRSFILPSFLLSGMPSAWLLSTITTSLRRKAHAWSRTSSTMCLLFTQSVQRSQLQTSLEDGDH